MGAHGPSEEDYLSYLRLQLGDTPVQARGYQAEAFCRALAEFEEGGRRSTLLVMPTGTGKTVTFLLVAKYVIERLGGRVLVVAHRGELITQAANAAGAVGLVPSIEKADEHARPDLTLGRGGGSLLPFAQPDGGGELDACGPDGDPKLVIASVQTLQGKRLKAWPKGHFRLVIRDEAHHATAETDRRLVAHLAPPWHLGVTATWDRGDGDPICGEGRVFESLAFEYTLTEAVERGYLARPVYECLPTAVDLSDIRTTGGDLNAGDLEKAIKPHIGALVNEARPSLEGRTFLAFTPDVGSADLAASAFRSVGVSCESVSGACHDRDEVIAAFKSGRYRGLANCALLTEGFDYPAVDAVVMMRPTKSRALFTQMVGRATRIMPGKSECLVVAFNWKTLRHRLVHPVQLFHADKLDPETLEIAEGLVDSGREPDLLLALKRAQAEKQQRERLRIEIEGRKRTARSIRFDALGFDPDRMPQRLETPGGPWEAKATDRQVAALERAGFKASEVVEWTKGRASGVLSALAKRRDQGLASYKQVQLLKRLGVPDAGKFTFDAASAEIDRRLNGHRAVG